MTYDPSLDANVLAAMRHPADFPGSYRTDTAGGTIANVGDFVKVCLGVTGATFEHGTDSRRPKLTADGLLYGTFDTTQRGLSVLNSQAYFKPLHATGVVRFKCRFKCDEGYGATTAPLFDNTNTSGTAAGVTITVHSMGGGQSDNRFIINNGTANVLQVRTNIPINDNEWHVFEGESFGTWGRIRVDRSAWVYAVATALPADVNAAQAAWTGNRASINTVFAGEISGLWIGTARATAEQEANWFERFPVGDIVGDPELNNGTLHFNIQANRGYNPVALWFDNKYAYNAPVTCDGVVIDDNGPDDSPDGTSWRGGPHGKETVNSVTWNGVPVVDGTDYTGNGTLVVHEQLGISYDAVKTVTINGATRTDLIEMTRLGDGRGIITSYPFRFNEGVSFGDILALDAEGNSLADFAAGNTGTPEHLPALTSGDPVGTRAVAQFSSTLNVMVLRVLTEGYGLDERITITGSTEYKKCYVGVRQERLNPAQGTEIKMKMVTKYYNTDSDSWKALAASETLKILADAPAGNSRMGIGLGIGL